MGRCTKAEQEKRVYQFIRLISAGAVRSELVQYAAKEWGVGPRSADVVIKQAREWVVADINQDREQVVAELIHTMKTVIKGSIQSKQYSNAIGAAALLAKLGRLVD